MFILILLYADVDPVIYSVYSNQYESYIYIIYLLLMYVPKVNEFHNPPIPQNSRRFSPELIYSSTLPTHIHTHTPSAKSGHDNSTRLRFVRSSRAEPPVLSRVPLNLKDRISPSLSPLPFPFSYSLSLSLTQNTLLFRMAQAHSNGNAFMAPTCIEKYVVVVARCSRISRVDNTYTLSWGLFSGDLIRGRQECALLIWGKFFSGFWLRRTNVFCCGEMYCDG